MRPILFSFIALLLLTSCGFTQPARSQKPVVVSCAEARLDSSFFFHNSAKGYFQSYYKTRKESELFYAWYASEDSRYMANSVRGCYDRKNKHFHAINNLMRKNRILQRLIAQNMRQDAQAQLSELYLEEYREIFVRDIQ